MSVRTVAIKDFLGARRSRSLWAVATLLALLTALIAFSQQGYMASDERTVVELFQLLGMVLAVLVPIVALVASYMSMAGERESGGIKFLLGLPNTRRDVFLGKLASRLAVVAGIVTFMFAAATSVAVAKNGALPVAVVVGLWAATVVYGSLFVCIAVALSSSVAARSRAIGAAIGSYFVLVVLYVVPTVRIGALVRWLHHSMLGLERSPDLYDAVTYTSPYIAYRKATNLALPSDMRRAIFRRTSEQPDLAWYLADEASLAVFAVWLVGPLVVGYLRFERSDLE